MLDNNKARASILVYIIKKGPVSIARCVSVREEFKKIIKLFFS